MVGAQKAINMASSLFPVRKRYSDTIIIDRTTSNIIKLIVPIFPIKFFNMVRVYCALLNIGIISKRRRFLHKKCIQKIHSLPPICRYQQNFSYLLPGQVCLFLFTLTTVHKTHQHSNKRNHHKGKNGYHDYAVTPIYQRN